MISMTKFRNLIRSIDQKRLFLLMIFAYISFLISFSYKKNHFESGYHFLFFFFLILPIILVFTVCMLQLVNKLEGTPRRPLYLLKYVIYFMILFVIILPFFYLWSLRDVIMHLKW